MTLCGLPNVLDDADVELSFGEVISTLRIDPRAPTRQWIHLRALDLTPLEAVTVKGVDSRIAAAVWKRQRRSAFSEELEAQEVNRVAEVDFAAIVRVDRIVAGHTVGSSQEEIPEDGDRIGRWSRP